MKLIIAFIYTYIYETYVTYNTIYGTYILWNWNWKLLSSVWLFANPWTIQSMEFSRPEYWSGFSAVTRSCLTLWPHGLRWARPPCPSPTPGVYSNSCPLSRWDHPTISYSVVPFSSRLQSFPASGSFPVNQFFASGGQSIGVSASASVLPMNAQGWFPLGLTGLDSLQAKGLSRVFS